MTIHYDSIPHMEWSDHPDPRICPRVVEVLQSWLGTPYMDGQRFRGVGANCIGFGSSVLDELYGTETAFPRLPSDMAMHDRVGAMKVMHTMMKAYPHERVRDNRLEPGDVLVTGAVGGGPGHIILVGGPNQLWQANTYCGVQYGGMALARDAQVLIRAFRMLEKDRWI